MPKDEIPPVDRLSAAYDVGSWKSLERLPKGKSRSYLLTATRGDYVLRCSHRSKTGESMRFEHELTTFLNRNGFPAPEAVATCGGETHVSLNGDLYCLWRFVEGSPFQSGNVRQLREAARAHAAYHQIVSSFEPSGPAPADMSLQEELRDALGEMPTYGSLRDTLLQRGEHDVSEVTECLDLVPYMLERAEAVLRQLDRLYASAPPITIHGGCRRGSALFEGDRLIAMLDFDSARPEVRALDLAIAVHDYAKVYSDADSPDHKVPLDVGIAGQFLREYQEVNSLSAAELETLPALLAARRLKRFLRKCRKWYDGVRDFSEGDMRKLHRETARVRWLDTHEEELEAALSGVPQAA
jgi:Ser/Thr protein kinase RdoA (MazF antagonist)